MRSGTLKTLTLRCRKELRMHSYGFVYLAYKAWKYFKTMVLALFHVFLVHTSAHSTFAGMNSPSTASITASKEILRVTGNG